MTEFKITRIPDDKKKGWSAEINGEKVEINRLKLTSKFGELEYGLKPEGYDGWIFKEQGGGGVITIPYTEIRDEIYVGLKLENRPNMGGRIFCAIGGFLDPKEIAEDAQKREAMEEANMDTKEAVILEGAPINPNRAFFVTKIKEGIKVFSFKVPTTSIEKPIDEGSFILKAKYLEKDSTIRFIRWQDAVMMTSDGIAKAGIAQLLANIL